jgi:hypothetical protein
MPSFDMNPDLAEFHVDELADMLLVGEDALMSEMFDVEAQLAILEVRPVYLRELIAREALDFTKVPARFLA